MTKKEHQQRYFVVGSYLHCLILTPELFNSQYYVSKKFDLRTTAGKESAKELAKENDGKECLFEEEIKMIESIAKNARQNKTFMELIKDAYFELSIYTQDLETGLKIRIRPDVISKTRSTMVDLKSIATGGARKFKYAVTDYGYNVSAAFYSDFGKKSNYLFYALEKEEPYQCSLYNLSDNLINLGREKYRMALDLLKFCYDNNHWPDYNQFAVMKEMYFIDALPNYFEQVENNNLIFTIE